MNSGRYLTHMPNTGSKKKMLILPRWYPNRKDIQLGVFIRQQALLLKNDFDIHVVYAQADENLISKYEQVSNHSDGIHEQIVYFRPGKGLLAKLLNAHRYGKAQELAIRNIQGKIDLCHVHVPYRSAFPAVHLHNVKKVPYYITEHWSGHLTGDFQKKNKADIALYKRILSKASGISCVSNLLAEKFKENTGYQPVVIPNFIEKHDSKDSFQSDQIEILSVGDMNDEIKNFSGLVNVFSETLKYNSRLHLTLIGGGPDEKKILNLIDSLNIKNHVQFLGRQNHAYVLKQMHHCHFYVCNSNKETFGMTVAEALRAGKPVISTRCGGPEEFLHENNALLTEPGNNETLKEAILKMSANFNTYQQDKIAAEMEEKFGEMTIRSKWLEFFK